MNVKIRKDVVDHIYHEKNDNRKSNLRICKQNQNARNSIIPKNNTSGFKGVTWSKQNKKWYAQIVVNRKTISLGHYDKIEDAIIARINAEEKYYGEYRYKEKPYE